MKSLATLLKVAQRRLDELGAEAGRIGTEIAALQERETSIRAREQAELANAARDPTFAAMLPAYRDGDRIVVAPAAPIRRGDRVVVQTTEGEIMAKELKRQTNRTVELTSLNPDHGDRSFPVSDIAWMARIMWVSQ